MPTKQFQELNDTASIRPDVKKQVMTIEPIQARSNSWLMYLVAFVVGFSFSMASMSSLLGEGVGQRSAIFFRAGLGLGGRDGIGVLFSVGAAELNFSRSMFDLVPSSCSRSKSTKVTARLAGATGDDILKV